MSAEHDTKKKPYAIKELQGFPSKRKEVKPAACKASKELEPPPQLGTIAMQEWNRIVPILADIDLVNDLDISILTAYCSVYADMILAMEKADENNGWIIEDQGTKKMIQEYKIYRDSIATLYKLSTKLGLSPCDRILATEDGAPESELSKHFEDDN